MSRTKSANKNTSKRASFSGGQLIGATTVGERGQIVIPKTIRDRLKMRPGTQVMVMQHGDSPIMVLPIEQMQEMIKQMSERVAQFTGKTSRTTS